MDVKRSLQRIGTLTHLAFLTVAVLQNPSYDYEDSEGSILQVCFSWELPHFGGILHHLSSAVVVLCTICRAAKGLRGSCTRRQQVGSMTSIAPSVWLCCHALVKTCRHSTMCSPWHTRPVVRISG